MLTAATEDFFTDDTFDSDVVELLRPHAGALNAHVQQGDPRVLELVRKCSDLADDVGIVFEATVDAAHRDDYALAAGGDAGKSTPAMIAAGVGSVAWSAVPTGIFDAAEDTVNWSIEAADEAVTAVVRVELSGLGSPNGIAVRLRSGPFGGAGVLAPTGMRRSLSSTRTSNRSRNRLPGPMIGARRR